MVTIVPSAIPLPMVMKAVAAVAAVVMAVFLVARERWRLPGGDIGGKSDDDFGGGGGDENDGLAGDVSGGDSGAILMAMTIRAPMTIQAPITTPAMSVMAITSSPIGGSVAALNVGVVVPAPDYNGKNI
eukprot:g7156.t1